MYKLVLLLVLTLGLCSCRTLSQDMEGPSPEEIMVTVTNIDSFRTSVILLQRAAVDDETKDQCAAVLKLLGDFREQQMKLRDDLLQKEASKQLSSD